MDIKKKYNIIYADPPWHFQNWNNDKAQTNPANHYKTMTMKDIENLPVSDIADKDFITFVDSNVKTLRYLKSNSEILSGPEYLFHKTDAYLFLGKTFKYDLIFADPPYSKCDLLLLAKKSLEHLNKNGKFILECEKSQEAILGAAKKNFGDTSVLFWTKS